MNFPNLLTLSRIPLMLMVIGLLYPEPSIWPLMRSIALLLFLFAALTDWLDGWLARRFGQVSEFGKFMDALADKVLTMGMFVSLLALGALEKWTLFFNSSYSIKRVFDYWFTTSCCSKRQNTCSGKNGEGKNSHSTSAFHFFGSIGHQTDGTKIFAAEDDFYSNAMNSSKYLGKSAFIIATFLTVISGIFYLTKYWKYFLED